MAKSVSLFACAKVNLYLEVVGKRPDGYHDLLTLFERIDLADEITVEEIPGGRIELTCDDPDLPCDGANLAVRAAEGYRRAIGSAQGFRILLRKRIPVGAGLGGGSSDAAATLQGLQQLTGDGLPAADLLTVAKGLGADVPFFLTQTPWALGKGRGDECEPLGIDTHLWHLLVFPRFPISTKSVYQALTPSGRLTPSGGDVTLLTRALRDSDVSRVPDLLFNALEPTVETLYPAIRDVKSAIRTAGGQLRPIVSGSGSTVMALCLSRAQAQEAARALKERRPQWQWFVAGTRD
ncbi:MAG: 4-(cytidine 5'-diphospho)-2-C-methyl-D-erythritol kinase [Candidatus Omnitrophica bacterium]|nr:4-(cytidine 5'-diphospho)-2-C-methyl-D-erythritol kinase [Candidatus Omnitrophota bacterium]